MTQYDDDTDDDDIVDLALLPFGRDTFRAMVGGKTLSLPTKAPLRAGLRLLAELGYGPATKVRIRHLGHVHTHGALGERAARVLAEPIATGRI